MRPLRDDSPLLNLPDGLQPEQRVWLEAVGYCLSISDVTYLRVAELLLEYAAGQQTVTRPTMSAVLADAWSLLDSAHRFGKLLQALPVGMKARRPKTSAPPTTTTRPRFKDVRKAYLVNQSAVEDLRNIVQHLDRELREKLSCTASPVWGSVAWITARGGRRGMLGSLHIGGGGSFELPIMTVPSTISGPIDHIHLHAHGHSVNLSERVRAMQDVALYLEDTLRPQFDRHPRAFSAGVMLGIEYGPVDDSPAAVHPAVAKSGATI